MEFLGVTSVGSITVVVYLIASLIKQTRLNGKWIPILCGALGGGLGLVAMAVVPDFPAEDAFTACAVGIVSGFAATGVNQVFRQLTAPDAAARNGARGGDRK